MDPASRRCVIVTKKIFGNASVIIRSLLIESVLGVALRLERITGLEPAPSAWEADALPDELNPQKINIYIINPKTKKVNPKTKINSKKRNPTEFLFYLSY